VKEGVRDRECLVRERKRDRERERERAPERGRQSAGKRWKEVGIDRE
jgi:hypothetical protein